MCLEPGCLLDAVIHGMVGTHAVHIRATKNKMHIILIYIKMKKQNKKRCWSAFVMYYKNVYAPVRTGVEHIDAQHMPGNMVPCER